MIVNDIYIVEISTYVGVCGWSFVTVRAINKAQSSTHSVFGSLRSFFAIRRSLFGLYNLEPSIFSLSCSSSSMWEPSIYTLWVVFGGIYML